MTDPIEDQDLGAARAYFLGDLPAEQATGIEIAVMQDPAFAERMTSAEAELIDDYLDGSLTPLERERCETVFMAVPERASRVRFARELAERAGGRRPREQAASPGFRPSLRLLLPMAATLLVATGVWLTLGRTRETRTATSPFVPAPVAPTASPSPGTTPGPAPAPPRRATFVLALGMARGTAPAPFTIPRGAEVVDLEIDLQGETRFAGFDARLTDDAGREIWRSPKGAPLRPSRDGVLMISVPVNSGLVAARRCELELIGRTALGEAQSVGVILVSFLIP